MTQDDTALIEKVAKALCKQAGYSADEGDQITRVQKDSPAPDYYDKHGTGCWFLWRRWEKAAIAAIKAMRIEK